MDREEESLHADYERGDITYKELSKAMRELQRDYAAEAEEAGGG